MDFGFAIRMDFAMNTDKLNLVNLVGKVMDEIVKFVFIKSYQEVKQHRLWLWDHKSDKLNLANLVGKVIDDIINPVGRYINMDPYSSGFLKS